MTVTELKNLLQEIEKNGEGNKQVVFETYESYDSCSKSFEIDVVENCEGVVILL